MIFITARFAVKPEHADDWIEISHGFSEETRAEDGCLWYDWSRSVDDPNLYVLVEAFADEAAGGVHVSSDHFREAQRTLPRYLSRTPDIVHVQIPQSGWSELGEMAVTA